MNSADRDGQVEPDQVTANHGTSMIPEAEASTITITAANISKSDSTSPGGKVQRTI